MITYVDTSTLLKLVVEEEGSEAAEVVWDAAEVRASVRLVVVEARAAVAAARRGRRLAAAQYEQVKVGLGELVEELHLIEVTAELVERASDLAEEHGLRGYDAVHLAAAVAVGASVLTSADEALCEAAGRCGLHVANPLVR